MTEQRCGDISSRHALLSQFFFLQCALKKIDYLLGVVLFVLFSFSVYKVLGLVWFLSRHFIFFSSFFVVVAAFVGKAKWVAALKAFVKVLFLFFVFVATYFSCR